MVLVVLVVLMFVAVLLLVMLLLGDSPGGIGLCKDGDKRKTERKCKKIRLLHDALADDLRFFFRWLKS